MAKNILIKPIISEKAEYLSEKGGQYSFMVDKKANKLEIKKAVETMYNVNVAAVNTNVVPRKMKVRNTKSGVQVGSKPAYKKAVITLATGETIDLFGDL
jgi:large subunit ribosomal protein L23